MRDPFPALSLSFRLISHFPPLESRHRSRTQANRRGGHIVYSENPVGCRIFAEWQMRVVSRSTYISQFPDVIAQKALLGSMRREEEEAASRRKCRSKRRWLRGRQKEAEEGGFSPPSFARTTEGRRGGRAGKGGRGVSGGCGRRETS